MQAEVKFTRRIVIVPADNPVRIEAIRELFKEYAASLSFNLCFQSFEEELARLPGEYAPWSGMLLLGLVDDQGPDASPCIAWRASWPDLTENSMAVPMYVR